MLTAGFRCAPEILPMNKMIAHHHQARGHHGRRAADDTGERLAHHATPGRDDDEQERAVQLREQAPPFLAGIIESPEFAAGRFAPLFPVSLAYDVVMRVGPARRAVLCPDYAAMAVRLRRFWLMWSAVPGLGPPPQKANVPLTGAVVSAVAGGSLPVGGWLRRVRGHVLGNFVRTSAGQSPSIQP